eukprot:9050741-Pyramimonas_sp.AAC.1
MGPRDVLAGGVVLWQFVPRIRRHPPSTVRTPSSLRVRSWPLEQGPSSSRGRRREASAHRGPRAARRPCSQEAPQGEDLLRYHVRRQPIAPGGWAVPRLIQGAAERRRSAIGGSVALAVPELGRGLGPRLRVGPPFPGVREALERVLGLRHQPLAEQCGQGRAQDI